jgi:uncharacterized membrane protein YedE/YeeE
MSTTVEFSPWASLGGGMLIGLGASLLLLGIGRVAGVSGIAGHGLFGGRGERGWRVAFLVGLVAAGGAMSWMVPAAFGASPRALPGVALAGLLVGVGTRIGGGCTSGHGVCGISRLSSRSLFATLTFIATAALTVALVRWLGGGA